MNASTKYRIALALIVSFALSACGGGGGGSSSGGTGDDISTPFSIFSPTQVSASDLVQGTRSTNTTGASAYGVARATLAARTISPTTTVSASSPLEWQLWPTKHITDTLADAAWADGWTGLGSSIAVIDDFVNPVKDGIRLTLNAQRTYTNASGSGIYDVAYKIDIPITHGNWVSTIAGGNGVGNTISQNANLNATSATLSSCLSGSCSASPILSSFDAPSTAITYTRIAGVAKEVDITGKHVDLSSSQNGAAALAAIAFEVDNNYNKSAINLSNGIDIISGSYAEVLSTLNPDFFSRTSDAVIVVAAGNFGAACTSSNLSGCNALAVAASVLPQTNKSTIVAGATSGSGTAVEGIANYSNRAGVLKERYLLAPGETGLYNTKGVELAGTSFAAPRITGAAAILRQKFPNLNGEKAASILLLTANKDINNDGRADFTGTSEIYGQGKLDLLKALSPIGTLSVR